MVAPVQGGEGLEPLAIAFLVVFEERPWVDVVGGGPEAGLFIAMALSVLRGVPVPATLCGGPHSQLLPGSLLGKTGQQGTVSTRTGRETFHC